MTSIDGIGEDAHKPSQPWWTKQREGWANDQLVASHSEALWWYGEFALFTLMWRPQDKTAGLVSDCPECSAASRSAAAFNQPERKKCPACYGTTFEGGFRAQIVRPALFKDRNQESNDTNRGAVTSDTLMVETTTDFTMRKGDYVFRADGLRYQCEEKDEGVVRTGFDHPDHPDSFSGHISGAHLEDPTSIAYVIPPDTADLRTRLAIPNTHFVPDLSALETIREGGYLL